MTQATINATRWPERDTVTDQTQGVQLATTQALASYWVTEYDWRKCEARLNALPQFITEIDGLDIHFIHGRSKHENALPLIVIHGWTGSVVEQLKIIDPLTNPNGPWRKCLLGFVVGTIGKGVLEKAFVNSVKAIEARNGAARERGAA